MRRRNKQVICLEQRKREIKEAGFVVLERGLEVKFKTQRPSMVGVSLLAKTVATNAFLLTAKILC